jgi:hypothetical protein
MPKKILHSGKFVLNGKSKMKWSLGTQNTAEENIKLTEESSSFCDDGEELTFYTNVAQTYKS